MHGISHSEIPLIELNYSIWEFIRNISNIIKDLFSG